MKKIVLSSLLKASLIGVCMANPIQSVDTYLNQALAVTNEIKYASFKARALAAIGSTMVKSGKVEEGKNLFVSAFKTAKDATVFPGAKIQSEVLLKAADAGELTLAKTLSLSMHPSRFKDGALTEVVIRLAEDGEIEEANSLVPSIVGPEFRALALNGIAGALIQSKEFNFQKRQEAYEQLYKIPTDGK